jgi:trafficking protein particle complex subunit 10
MHPALYAGQPISAILSITPTFHWAPTDNLTNQSYNMRFDVGELSTDWLVSGRKTGDFIAKVGAFMFIKVAIKNSNLTTFCRMVEHMRHI